MKKYLLTGPSGTGKTTVARELARRGYPIIETDNVPNLSSWTNLKTRELVLHNPPFSEDWLATHRFLWDEQHMVRLINSLSQENTFLVGDAFNSSFFFELFDKIFAFNVAGRVLIERLRLREPERWLENSPEVKDILKWNKSFPDIYRAKGVLFIDGSLPTKKIADRIESSIREN